MMGTEPRGWKVVPDEQPGVAIPVLGPDVGHFGATIPILMCLPCDELYSSFRCLLCFQEYYHEEWADHIQGFHGEDIEETIIEL